MATSVHVSVTVLQLQGRTAVVTHKLDLIQCMHADQNHILVLLLNASWPNVNKLVSCLPLCTTSSDRHCQAKAIQVNS